jgi:hypothetical protein
MRQKAFRVVKLWSLPHDPIKEYHWQNALRCADNLKICSCWMCRNPRRAFGEPTRREALDDRLAKYELESFSPDLRSATQVQQTV